MSNLTWKSTVIGLQNGDKVDFSNNFRLYFVYCFWFKTIRRSRDFYILRSEVLSWNYHKSAIWKLINFIIVVTKCKSILNSFGAHRAAKESLCIGKDWNGSNWDYTRADHMWFNQLNGSKYVLWVSLGRFPWWFAQDSHRIPITYTKCIHKLCNCPTPLDYM